MATKIKKILVVDDLADWRKTLRGLLVDLGYDVETADLFKNAVNIMKNQAFDLALLDVRLDETDEKNTEGLDLAAKIKTLRPSIKIIIITGDETQEIMEKALKADIKGKKLAENFVLKTNTEELLEMINIALAR